MFLKKQYNFQLRCTLFTEKTLKEYKFIPTRAVYDRLEY